MFVATMKESVVSLGGKKFELSDFRICLIELRNNIVKIFYRQNVKKLSFSQILHFLSRPVRDADGDNIIFRSIIMDGNRELEYALKNLIDKEDDGRLETVKSKEKTFYCLSKAP